MKKVIVIGGGAAGMMAAIKASENNEVYLFEKNEKLGKKLYITGKGRCNVTNAVDCETLIANTPSNPYFMYSAFYGFDSQSTMNFFEDLSVPVKVERGNRVFPMSEKSSDIILAMEKKLRQNHVKINLNTNVKDILVQDATIQGIITEHTTEYADAVIIATGGLSYPMTGSTGDGYKFAKSVGHKVTKLYPSLVPLKIKEDWIKELQGLSLKNIEISVKEKGKEIYSNFGELLFTHFGVSGPVILSASRFITDKINRNIQICIDLKPALSEKELDTRLLRDFDKYKNKNFNNSLDDLLPQKLIPIIIELSGINAFKKVNEVTKEERKKLLELLKNLQLTVTDTTGYNEAVITAGGIDVAEIDPSTMESKLVKNLYFAGEVIDVDSFTGGFNLQVAFSTGQLAGRTGGL